jgi:hypothetical protein
MEQQHPGGRSQRKDRDFRRWFGAIMIAAQKGKVKWGKRIG